MSYLNLGLVHTLLVILEEGSFRQAADRLHLTPPAVTQQIKRLEELVGYSLIERGTAPSRLTERGEAFVVHARESLEASDRALGITDKQTLKLGFIEGYPRGNDEEFIVRLKDANPDLVLEFIQVDWGSQITKLLAGEIDAALARPPIENMENIEKIKIFQEPLVAAVLTDSELATQESLLLKDLEGMQVVRARGTADSWAKYAAVDPRPSSRPVNYGWSVRTIEEALLAVVMAENVFLTGQSVGERYNHPKVRYIPVDDGPYREVELCTRSSDHREMTRVLRRVARGLLKSSA